MNVKHFYSIAFIYSWTIWLLGILFFNNSNLVYPLISIGGLGPFLATIIFIYKSKEKNFKKNYFYRLLHFDKKMSPYLIITIALPFFISILSNLIGFLFFNSYINIKDIFFLDPEFKESGIIYAIFLIFFGPIPEEMGWRGIAFDKLIKKHPYIITQIIVAILWATWHLPLFFIKGSYQEQLGLFSFEFFLFFLNILVISFLTGYIYIKSNYSILLAIIFHYTINLSGEMFSTSTPSKFISFFIYLITIIVFEILNKRYLYDRKI